MRLTRFTDATDERIYASRDGERWTRLDGLPRGTGFADLLAPDRRADLLARLDSGPAADPEEVRFERAGTVLGAQGDIWGAGLNFRKHSEDLSTDQPATGPGSYLRPSGCLIGNGERIELPRQSRRITAEAELGLLIGTRCKNVDRADWRQVIAGVTVVMDMTAEDVIRENPRYIPWAKGFDTFCSAGPQLVTLDEFTDDQLQALTVATIRNDETVATSPVSGMLYDLGYLVEYFTAGRTLPAGSLLCTGTPGAAVINPGDRVQAVVENVGTLAHPVT